MTTTAGEPAKSDLLRSVRLGDIVAGTSVVRVA